MTILQFIGQYRFLSNFWPSSIEYGGITYPTVEHAYQAQKTTNPIIHRMMSELPSPSMAKSHGKRVTLRDDWDEVKTRIMEELLRKKFEIPELRQMLKETEPHSLVEGNHWGDDFWGVDLKKGKGQNVLGILLMRIRGEIE